MCKLLNVNFTDFFIKTYDFYPKIGQLKFLDIKFFRVEPPSILSFQKSLIYSTNPMGTKKASDEFLVKIMYTIVILIDMTIVNTNFDGGKISPHAAIYFCAHFVCRI